ncbi:hypothetical protein HNO92_003932 [Chromobacterium alkanivorans]|nr:hypothetical protein [Chromobacterium alkanivorans]MCS3817963.1 hypothetical protein [Chromobacterium alkanivorans]MCS3875583.1 hypothetical protein [Chromobacterium alkanivorans]
MNAEGKRLNGTDATMRRRSGGGLRSGAEGLEGQSGRREGGARWRAYFTLTPLNS